jgi:cyanate lyase
MRNQNSAKLSQKEKSMTKPMKRTDVTELVMEAKIKKGLSWTKIAKAVGASKEWTTAALLGQMQMTKAQAVAAGKLLSLPPYAVARCLRRCPLIR